MSFTRNTVSDTDDAIDTSLTMLFAACGLLIGATLADSAVFGVFGVVLLAFAAVFVGVHE
jgi:hypothetical protein